MPESVSPAFVRLNYHSAYGIHVAEIPTLEWNPDVPGGTAGKFDTWDGSVRTDADMISDLVDALKGAFPSSCEYDNYIIYTQASPTADPVPRSSAGLAVAGTLAVPGWSKAAQTTLTWRSTTFGLFKIVLLDAGTIDVWDKITTLPGSGVAFDIDDQVTAVTNGWSARDNGRPQTFVSQTKDLNDRLRKAYRMS